MPETHEWVREVCRDFDWPLHELHPDVSYEDLVLKGRFSKRTGKWIQGFPCGPMSHNTMLWFLKEKPLRAFVQARKTHRNDCIGLVTGIRSDESDRRMGADMAVPSKRVGGYFWINPILAWTPTDKNRYMEQFSLARNPIADLLGRSAECLCGALARREELADIAGYCPEVGERIFALERKAKAAGIDDHFWAMKSPVNAHQGELFEPSFLCHGCVQRYEEAA